MTDRLYRVKISRDVWVLAEDKVEASSYAMESVSLGPLFEPEEWTQDPVLVTSAVDLTDEEREIVPWCADEGETVGAWLDFQAQAEVGFVDPEEGA